MCIRDRSKHEKELKNYFATSSYYPQQTAVLGLLRYLCLIASNNLESQDKTSIIGSNFDVDNARQDKGWIEKISPLTIVKIEEGVVKECYIPKAIRNQINNRIQTLKNINLKSRIENTYNCYYSLTSAFDYKKFDTGVQWVDQDDNIQKEIFEKSLTKSGVNIAINKLKEEGGYYKQTMQKLKKKHAFGVWVNLASIHELDLAKTYLLPFGADQGLFNIQFYENIDDKFEDEGIVSNTIHLLSDAFICKDMHQYIDFGLNESIDFRFIKSKAKEYYQINNSAGKGDKSDKYTLMQRGSVLYCNDGKAIGSLLRANINFREIGYNYYKYI